MTTYKTAEISATAPTDGQTLKYNATDKLWEPADAGGGIGGAMPQPSAPQSLNRLGVGYIYWDGLDHTGAVMPAGFAKLSMQHQAPLATYTDKANWDGTAQAEGGGGTVNPFTPTGFVEVDSSTTEETYSGTLAPPAWYLAPANNPTGPWGPWSLGSIIGVDTGASDAAQRVKMTYDVSGGHVTPAAVRLLFGLATSDGSDKTSVICVVETGSNHLAECIELASNGGAGTAGPAITLPADYGADGVVDVAIEGSNVVFRDATGTTVLSTAHGVTVPSGHFIAAEVVAYMTKIDIQAGTMGETAWAEFATLNGPGGVLAPISGDVSFMPINDLGQDGTRSATTTVSYPTDAVTALASLTDADITSPTDGDVLTYVAADGKWEAKASAGGSANPAHFNGDPWINWNQDAVGGYSPFSVNESLGDGGYTGLSSYATQSAPSATAGDGFASSPFHYDGQSAYLSVEFGTGPDCGVVHAYLWNLDTGVKTEVSSTGGQDCYTAAKGVIGFGGDVGPIAAGTYCLYFEVGSKNASSTGYRYVVGRFGISEAYPS